MSNEKQNTRRRTASFSSNKSKIFKSTDHANAVSKKLHTFTEEKKFCDIVLIAETDKSKVHAHRNVLSASSDYFEAMFSSRMREAKADEVRLKIDGATLKLIVGFMYTGTIELSIETVESILRSAIFFQMNALVDVCCDFMGSELDENNCFGITLMAEELNCPTLHKTSSNFVFEHFQKLCEGEEFLQLNEKQLLELISDDRIHLDSEEILFLRLAPWVEYDKPNREKLILNLLTYVRFTFLTPKFIIENRHSVCKTIECYELICGWIEWHLSPEKRTQLPSVNTNPRKTNEKLTFTNGYFSDDMKVQTYNQDLNKWLVMELPRAPRSRVKYAVIAVNKKLYVVGGKICEDPTYNVECLDMQTKKWTYMPPMRKARCLPGLAELNGDLYVVGGYGGNGVNWMCTAEKYDFFTREWQYVAPTSIKQEYIKIAAVDGLLYAVGDSQYAMECYDPDANEWTPKTFTNEESKAFGFAALNGLLYAVGGHRNVGASNTVECYHPSTDTWTQVASLEVPKYNLICAAFDNRLIACRGSSREFLRTVEEYNPVTSEWKILGYSLDPFCREDRTSSLFTM